MLFRHTHTKQLTLIVYWLRKSQEPLSMLFKVYKPIKCDISFGGDVRK